MPAAEAHFVGWGHEEGDPLNQRQVSRHQSKCRLDGFGWPQLPLERFEVWYVWNVAAPEVAPSRSSHVHTPSQKWTLPPNFLPTSCYHERCCNWSAGCRHQTVARGKMAQWRSWWCPTRSFASIVNASEILPQRLDIHPFIFSPPHGLVYVACPPP